MYRKGEGKLFPSPEEVPAGEGWQDAPLPADAEPEVAPDADGTEKARQTSKEPRGFR